MGHFMIEYVSGCCGGIAGVLVGQPFDTVKVRLQTQGTRYTGIRHCFRSIIQKESINGLFKGMSSPLLGLSLINAIVFGVEAQSIRYLGKETTFTHMVCGGFAGAVQTIVCSPMELAKTQMQVQGIGSKKSSSKIVYRNSVDVLLKVYQKDGVRGCYRGMVITLMRETPAFATYFASYDILTSTIFKVSKNDPYDAKLIGNMLMAGGFAGMSSWLVTYPVDVVKSHLQADGSEGRAHRYKGIRDCCAQIYKKEGYQGFVRGLNSSLLRAFPVNAATFAVVHIMSQYLSSR